ncbi:ECF transporter S component, partial [Candidatus Bathyarchaeota archaeon]|nr:ECF transporter S component [Candidatus Bathyarchaeota archaeon]
KGYFNIGETMVYTAALLFGPLVGGVAGGFGSMLADLLLGYYQYAPATLVIKAVEGYIVGLISLKGINLVNPKNRVRWRFFSVGSGLLTGGLVILIGSAFYSGYMELYSSIISAGPATVTFVPVEFWIALGAAVAFLISVAALKFEPEFGLTVIACLSGGLLMVLGYFLYEQFFLGVFAIAEIPVNIGQMTIGLIVATPIVKVIKRMLPQLKAESTT